MPSYSVVTRMMKSIIITINVNPARINAISKMVMRIYASTIILIPPIIDEYAAR